MPENTRPDDEIPADLWSVDRLLADPESARDTAEQDLATLFAVLRAPAEPDELAGERELLAACDAARALETAPPTSRRTSMLAPFLAAKTTVAAAAIAACAAGATGAYTGSLPSGLQNVAHRTIGAPAHEEHPDTPKATPTAHPSSSTSAKADDGDRTGRDHGLCTAYRRGGLPTHSTAYETLAKAAGGPAEIPDFCAARTAPSGAPSAHPSARPTGDPGDRGNGGRDGHATGRPSDAPDKPGDGAGKPAVTPTGKPSVPAKP
jgi:hypothetical protein